MFRLKGFACLNEINENRNKINTLMIDGFSWKLIHTIIEISIRVPFALNDAYISSIC